MTEAERTARCSRCGGPLTTVYVRVAGIVKSVAVNDCATCDREQPEEKP